MHLHQSFSHDSGQLEDPWSSSEAVHSFFGGTAGNQNDLKERQERMVSGVAAWRRLKFWSDPRDLVLVLGSSSCQGYLFHLLGPVVTHNQHYNTVSGIGGHDA
jgi:hypothetical protein